MRKSGSNWVATVPVGASTISGNYINGTLKDSCGTTTLLSNAPGYVYTNLPTPYKVTITASAHTIARPGTVAALALWYPTTSQLTVTMYFNSTAGVITTKVMTVDTRTVYTSTFTGATGYTTTANGTAGGGVALNSTVGATTAGTVLVVVSFPTYGPAVNVTANITLTVVDISTTTPITSTVGFVSPTSLHAVSAAYPLRSPSRSRTAPTSTTRSAPSPRSPAC